jgi:hypothetical protein
VSLGKLLHLSDLNRFQIDHLVTETICRAIRKIRKNMQSLAQGLVYTGVQ